MNPLYVDGALPRPAANSSTTGPVPRNDAAARARAKELAMLFAAQVEQSMSESLAGLSMDAEEEDADGEQDAGIDLGGLDALSGASGLGSSALAKAGAGDESKLAQQLLAAYAALDAPSGTGSGAITGASGAASVSGSRDVKANAGVVADVAREQGVDPVVAVAMMLVESGGNAGAVGDGGTSFGLFQLHKGGMLTAAGLTAQQAFDPRTNAAVSLKSLAHEWKKGPNRSPGAIAAASQRPADPAGYARKVDAMMDRARSLLGA